MTGLTLDFAGERPDRKLKVELIANGQQYKKEISRGSALKWEFNEMMFVVNYVPISMTY